MATRDEEIHRDHISNLPCDAGPRDRQIPDYSRWSKEELTDEARQSRRTIDDIRRNGWSEADRRLFLDDESFELALGSERDVVEMCQRRLIFVDRELKRRLDDLLSTKPQVE